MEPTPHYPFVLFSRLLVASMQSICLEGVGGEKKVDPRLQETTFIQYTFGGRLRSKVNSHLFPCKRCTSSFFCFCILFPEITKSESHLFQVKCLRCHHESERYENIMDLTLEIYGPVESLEDALTQFTTPEDLDGENMYRCGRLDPILHRLVTCIYFACPYLPLSKHFVMTRCAAYVRARKQLSIHEAPNILTIVLKRFQVAF